MKSAAVFPHAITTLRTATDYQLLRTAAVSLRSVPVEAKEDASNALIFALNRLTAQATDTSRDPRVAIIERLGEVLAPERSSDVLPYVSDYDDAVVVAARKSFQTLVGTDAARGAMRRRYPYQPTTDQLSRLPTEAVIQLESGSVTLKLLTDVAPVTVARFAELAAQGVYNNRTFHRIVPNFVVQGGSPGANEYAGATGRYMRDEVGPQASHVRGAVGISSRGADTGDAQIFINLVDLPRLDRDYTVFAYVISGMELVDEMLEGAKILSVAVK
jgi:cyclophilin family peptidyl-prolyl cis-trans isomerase